MNRDEIAKLVIRLRGSANRADKLPDWPWLAQDLRKAADLIEDQCGGWQELARPLYGRPL